MRLILVSLELDPDSTNFDHEQVCIEVDGSESSLRGDLIAEAIQRPISPRAQLTNLKPNAQGKVRRSAFQAPLDRYLRGDDLIGFRDDPVESAGEWHRLRTARTKVLRRRAQVRTKRSMIYEQHQKRLQADQAFMKYVRGSFAGHQIQPDYDSHVALPDAVFEYHYSKLQAVRDECGPLEFELEMLESQLNEAELDLTKLENRVYDTHNLEDCDSDSESLTSQPDPLLGVSSKYHPLHHQYLSSLGDLDLAEERHQVLLQEKDRILSSLETKTSVGIELSTAEQEFLNMFDSRENEILSEISDIENEVQLIREKCSAQGINIDGDGHSEDGFSHGDEQANCLTENILKKSDRDSASMFPLLLPRFQEDKLRVLITDFIEGDKSDRINRWLLHQVRTSLHEVELLIRVFLQVNDELTPAQSQISAMLWETGVMFWWMRDGGNKLVGDSLASGRAG